MSVSHHTRPGKKSTRTDELVSPVERAAAARVASLLSADLDQRGVAVEVVKHKGQRIALPAALMDVMRRAAELLAEGKSVAVLADEGMLSTQAAANLLNVSRQYLVRLIDDGRLPAVKVGSHRRLHASDVAAFKAARDAERKSALDRLAELSEAGGGYWVDTKSRRKSGQR